MAGNVPSIKIIAGKYKNRLLCFAKQKQMRPTSQHVREAAFNILTHRFFPHTIGHPPDSFLSGKRVLDLFSGVGGYGFEALSRGAREVVFIDNDPVCTKRITAHCDMLNVRNCTRVLISSLPTLPFMEGAFDIIFLDPPYKAHGLLRNTLLALLRSSLMHRDTLLVIEQAGTALGEELTSDLYTCLLERMSRKALLSFLRPIQRDTELSENTAHKLAQPLACSCSVEDPKDPEDVLDGAALNRPQRERLS